MGMRKRRKRKSYGWHWKQRKPCSPPPPPIVLEDVMLMEDGVELKFEKYQRETENACEVVDMETEGGEEVISLSDDEEPEKGSRAVETEAADLRAMAMLVKQHCVFCLTRKRETILKVTGRTLANSEEGGGDCYELLRQYIGPKTAECLNDIYDVMVFGNKKLLAAEFPAPLLCEECVTIMRELEVLHNDLEVVQMKVLRKIKVMREFVMDNMEGKEGKTSGKRLAFETDVLGDCNGEKGTAKYVEDILNKFQEGFEEETRDPVEIHLEHLQQVRSFEAKDCLDLDTSATVYVTVKETSTKETQTDYESEVIRYEVNIVKIFDGKNVDSTVSQLQSNAESISETPPDSRDGRKKQDNVVVTLDSDSEEQENNEITLDSDSDERENEEGTLQLHSEAQPNNEVALHSDLDGNSNHQDGTGNSGVDAVADEIPVTDGVVDVDCPSASSTEDLPPVQMTTHEANSEFEHIDASPHVVDEYIDFSDLLLCSNPSPVPSASSSPPPEATPTLDESSKSPKFVTHLPNGVSIVRGGSSSVIEILRKKSPIAPVNQTETTPITESEGDQGTNARHGVAVLTKRQQGRDTQNESEIETDMTDDSGEGSSNGDSEDDSDDEENTREPPSKRKKASKDRNSYVCSICKQEFDNKGGIYKHIRQVHNKEPLIPEKKTGGLFNCIVADCERGFSKRGEVRQHLTNYHKLSESDQDRLGKLYKCELCGFSHFWLSYMEFMEHLLDHEMQTKNWSCKDCLQEFTTKQMYQLHPCPQYGYPAGKRSIVDKNFAHLRNEFICRLCANDDDLLSENHLVKHFESCHGSKDAFACSECRTGEGITFKSKTSLNAHMIEKHEAIPFRCRICEDVDRQFGTYEELYIHLHSSHFGTNYNCPRCPRRFSTSQRLNVHLAGHAQFKLFKCEFCGRELKNRVGLDHHVREMHAGNVQKIATESQDESAILESRAYSLDKSSEPLRRDGKPKPFKCILCLFASSKFNLYRLHMHLCHGVLLDRNQQSRQYTCQICGYFSNTARLYKFIAHLSEHEDLDLKRFSCEDCMDSFTNQQMYQMHKCPQTGKLPGTATVLRQGSTHVTKEKQCRICDDRFSSDVSMQAHCKKAHNENAFGCELCVNAFNCRTTLASHMITAHNAVPFKCRICEPAKSFKTFHEILSHSNMEHFGRCHQCTVCSAKFLDNLSLQDHMDTHAEVRAYICTICGAALKSRATLARHMKAIHTEGGLKVPCEHCGKEYTADNISKHVRAIHGVERESSSRKTRQQKK